MKHIAVIASLTGLASVAFFSSVTTQADEYGAKRHRVTRHSQIQRVSYDRCLEQVVVRQTGYRYYPHAQIYSFEPQEFTKTYCARFVTN
jgi:hypothetical protein